MPILRRSSISHERQQFANCVHNLQRERGLSCAFVASGGSGGFDDLLQEQRKLSDALPLGSDTFAIMHDIRKLADAAVMSPFQSSSAAAVAQSFYSTFSRFNELIKRLIDGQELASRSDVYLSFTRLKEATGVERAFLCGALSLAPDALAHLPSRAFADLVVGMQAQRVHEAAVREAAPPMLLELIRAGFEYSTAELREVQSRLLADFDLVRLRRTLTAQRCWVLMTEHIDKLERVQALLLRELEKQRESAGLASTACREMLGALAAQATTRVDVASASAALEKVSALPAAELKKELVQMLTATVAAARATDRSAAQTAAAAARAAASDAVAIGGNLGSSPVLTASHPPPTETLPLYLSRSLDNEDDDSIEAFFEAVPDAMRIELHALQFQRRIGQGAAGVTYHSTHAGGDVAVKIACGARGLREWRKEVLALCQLRHPNVVHCIGVVVAPPSFGLVLEYCAGGSLDLALSRPTPPGFVLQVAIGVAAGMVHLHGRGVLHRDLKGANVLIDAAGVAKLADFGLAVAAPNDTRRGAWLTGETGTFRWMAPEVICHDRYAKPADVYSFGCVLVECLCRHPPFADLPPLQAAVAVGLNDQRPPLPDNTPPPLLELVASCWLREATARPSFVTLHSALVSLPAQLSAAQQRWLDAPDGHPVVLETGGARDAERQQQQAQQAGHAQRHLPDEAAEGIASSSTQPEAEVVHGLAKFMGRVFRLEP